MLRRKHHGVDALGLAVHVLDADLALGVGTQVSELAIAAHVTLLADQLVRHHDRQRHQFRRLIAGVAEHQALIARAAGIHAHGDVGGLALNGVQNAAGLGIEAHSGVGESDVRDHFARQLRHVDVGRGGDLAGHHADSGGDQNFAGHAASGIVFHDGVEYGVGNLIRHLVRVAFAHRFGRENVSHFIGHSLSF